VDPDGEPIRFVDVLTMASAVGSYLGAGEVTAEHVAHALAVLEGNAAIEGLGRGVSPLVPKPPGGIGVSEQVRAFVQGWVSRPGNDPTCPLGDERLALLRGEIAALVSKDHS
jgi:hypothetical protein